MSEVYAGQAPQYASDWTIEQAEANAPEGARVRFNDNGGLAGCEGFVVSYEMKKGAGSWFAEARVKLTAPDPFIGFPVHLVPVQKVSASRLIRIDEDGDPSDHVRPYREQGIRKFWNWFWAGYEGGGINDEDSNAPGNVAHRTFKGALWSPFCDWMARAYVEGYKRGQADARRSAS